MEQIKRTLRNSDLADLIGDVIGAICLAVMFIAALLLPAIF